MLVLSTQNDRRNIMHSILTAAAFLFMLVVPCLVAQRAGAASGDE